MRVNGKMDPKDNFFSFYFLLLSSASFEFIMPFFLSASQGGKVRLLIEDVSSFVIEELYF